MSPRGQCLVLFSLSSTPILFLKLCPVTLFHIIVSLMTTSCTNLATLHSFLKLTQSCISDVKSWMTNNQLQLNNDKTEMILIAIKTVLNSDCVPQSINLEGSHIKFANTVRNLGVCLDPTLSFQQRISSVRRVCYLQLCRISAIRHYLSEDVTKKL